MNSSQHVALILLGRLTTVSKNFIGKYLRIPNILIRVSNAVIF